MTPRERWRATCRTVRLIDRDWASADYKRTRDAYAIDRLVERAVRLFRDDPIPTTRPEQSRNEDAISNYQRALTHAKKDPSDGENRRDYRMWMAYMVVASVRARTSSRWPGSDELSDCYQLAGNSGWRVWLLADREHRSGVVGPGIVLVRSFRRKVLAHEYRPLLSAAEWIAAASAMLDATTA